MIDHSDPIVKIVDVAAGTTVIGTVLGWLPGVAAGFAIVWYCVLLYDRFVKKKASAELPTGD